jgi:hypothetical protein
VFKAAGASTWATVAVVAAAQVLIVQQHHNVAFSALEADDCSYAFCICRHCR